MGRCIEKRLTSQCKLPDRRETASSTRVSNPTLKKQVMLPRSDGSHLDGVSDHSQSSGSEAPFTVTFPQKDDPKSLQQDEEYAKVQLGEKKQKIRIHVFNTMYAQPGLYESKPSRHFDFL